MEHFLLKSWQGPENAPSFNANGLQNTQYE